MITSFSHIYSTSKVVWGTLGAAMGVHVCLILFGKPWPGCIFKSLAGKDSSLSLLQLTAWQFGM
jgi:hypothetical protein